jgi:hypothetical protein
LENLITYDQSLTIRVIRMANSAFYRGYQQVTTVREAIMRLGSNEVINILLLISLRENFPTRDPWLASGVFVAVRFSIRSFGKTETIASNFSWLEVRELWKKGEEDDQPKKGEILKYLRTGGLFEVKNITNDFVILYALDGSIQIMTGKRGFDSVFAKVPSIESPRTDLNSRSKYLVPVSVWQFEAGRYWLLVDGSSLLVQSPKTRNLLPTTSKQ